MLSSKMLLPTDSYTYISEAWHTTSWLDHCICTADAHNCLVEAEILYKLTVVDHIPVSITLDLESLPELTSSDKQDCGKIDWAKLSEYDLWKYNCQTDISLSNIDVPCEAIICNDIKCKNVEHHSNTLKMYERMVTSLINVSTLFVQEKRKHKTMPGRSDHVSELYAETKEAKIALFFIVHRYIQHTSGAIIVKVRLTRSR